MQEDKGKIRRWKRSYPQFYPHKVDKSLCGKDKCEQRGKSRNDVEKRNLPGKVDFSHFLSEDMVNCLSTKKNRGDI